MPVPPLWLLLLLPRAGRRSARGAKAAAKGQRQRYRHEQIAHDV